MGISVDIQMPVKKGSYVRADVIGAFLRQEIDWEIYINVKNETPFPKIDKEDFDLISESLGNMKDIEARIKIAHKRNELIEMGTSAYVYLADADVLLNDDWNSDVFNDIFYELIMGLERHPRIGAIGLPYQLGYHVGAGSMMLRRSDLPYIGEIKGSGSYCTCGYISHKLLYAGLFTVPLKTIRAKHLKMDSSAGEYQRKMEEEVEIDSDNIHVFMNDYIWNWTNEGMEEILSKIAGYDEVKRDRSREDYMEFLSGYKLIFHSPANLSTL